MDSSISINPVLTVIDILTVVNVLNNDPSIFTRIIRVMHMMGVPSSHRKKLRDRFYMGAITGDYLLSVILKIWVGKNGSTATFLRLSNLLKENHFNYCADQLQKTLPYRFPPYSDAVPVLPKREDDPLPNSVMDVSPKIAEFAQPSTSTAQRKKSDRLQRLNRWKSFLVESFLGAGSFGFVFKLKKDPASEPTAVKIVLDDFHHSDTAESDDIKKTNNELQAMTKLSKHENVVQLISHDVIFATTNASMKGLLEHYGDVISIRTFNDANMVGRFNYYTERSHIHNTFVLVMELCGPTLRAWLKSEETWKQLKDSNLEFANSQVRIAQGIIAGLKHIHQNHMMHRDLKPENIYFAKEGFQGPVKIGDFGVTRQMSADATVTETKPEGTKIYQAPETKTGSYGRQSDLYSLGLILWEVCELVPFTTFNHLEARFEQLTIDRDEDG